MDNVLIENKILLAMNLIVTIEKTFFDALSSSRCKAVLVSRDVIAVINPPILLMKAIVGWESFKWVYGSGFSAKISIAAATLLSNN